MGFHNSLSFKNSRIEKRFKLVKEDICLMQNIYQVADVKAVVNTLVELPCCGGSILLKKCIPGLAECPNRGTCTAKFRYSWCLGVFFEEFNNPRNHCEVCRRCTNSNYQHCYRCNRCYLAGKPPTTCVNCYPPAED
ncbi:unnamed protein product [Gordionus sp. m RMFG-2023]